jgi:hypothetical protein
MRAVREWRRMLEWLVEESLLDDEGLVGENGLVGVGGFLVASSICCNLSAYADFLVFIKLIFFVLEIGAGLLRMIVCLSSVGCGG